MEKTDYDAMSRELVNARPGGSLWTAAHDAVFQKGFRSGVEHARRTPPPATAMILDEFRNAIAEGYQSIPVIREEMKDILAEWPE